MKKTKTNRDIFLNKPLVCCVSDIHVGVHQNGAQWHKITLDWAQWLSKELKKKKIEDIIISGDFFHYRDEIAVNTLHFATKVLDVWKDFNIIMLVGNHDAYYKDKSDVNSLSILDGWNNITVLSELSTADLFGRTTTFCPWGIKSSDIPESDLIFGHFEIKSFKQNMHKMCASGMSASDLLEKTNLVVSGHFHLRDERVYENGKILYLGNPFEMDFGDMDNKKGYYTLDFNTLKYEFTENKLSPKHKKIFLSDLAKAGKLTPEIKKQFTNNFIRFVVDRNISADEIDIVLKKFMSLQPTNINVEYAINFSKYRIEDDTIKDFSGVDIPVAIEEFVNLLEIENKKEVTDYTMSLFRRCAQ